MTIDIPTPSQAAISKSYQVVVLKNKKTGVKLDELCLKDGNAETIAAGIAKVLEEYNLWNAINKIIATNINAGKKNGVVVKL